MPLLAREVGTAEVGLFFSPSPSWSEFFCGDDAIGASASGATALLKKNSIDRRVCSVLTLLLVLSSCSPRCPCFSFSVCPWRRVRRWGYCFFLPRCRCVLCLVRLWSRARRRCSCSCCSPCCCSPLFCWAAWPWSPASRGIAHFALAVCRAIFFVVVGRGLGVAHSPPATWGWCL